MTKKFQFFETTAKEWVTDNFTRKNYWYVFSIAGISLLVLGITWSFLPQAVPLFYSKPWGSARLVPKIYLGLPVLISVFMSLFNIMIVKLLLNDDVFLSKTLSVVSLIIEIIMSFVVFNVIFLMII